MEQRALGYHPRKNLIAYGILQMENGWFGTENFIFWISPEYQIRQIRIFYATESQHAWGCSDWRVHILGV